MLLKCCVIALTYIQRNGFMLLCQEQLAAKALLQVNQRIAFIIFTIAMNLTLTSLQFRASNFTPRCITAFLEYNRLRGKDENQHGIYCTAFTTAN